MYKSNKVVRKRTGDLLKTGKGTAISKTKRKPKEYEGISSTYEAARRDKSKSKAKPKTEKKITKSKRTKNPFGLDPSKKLPVPKGEVTVYWKKPVTSKPSRHGPGTYGAVSRPSDIKYGRRKPLNTRIKPPHKPPSPSRTPILGVGHSANEKFAEDVRNTRKDNIQRATEAAELAAAKGRAKAKEAEKKEAARHQQRAAQLSSEAEQRNLDATQLRNQKRNRERVLAERAAAREGPPKKRWPGAMQRRVSTKDQGVLDTGLRLEGDPIESTPKQKHQQMQKLKNLVAKYGGKIRDYWNAAQNRPLSDAEARAKAGLDATKSRVRSGVGYSAVKQYKGGQPKKKKKSPSRRVKNRHKGYANHDGNKFVGANYSQENNMGPHTLLKNPPDLEKINGKPTGQGYGAAREGPDVVGTPHADVVDEKYDKGKSFKLDHNSVKNIHVR